VAVLVDRPLAEEIVRLTVDFGLSIGTAVGAAEPGSGAESWPLGGGCVVYTGPGMYENGAKGLGVLAPVADGDLDRIEAYFDERAIATHIELCPWAAEDLVQRLAARGYVLCAMRTYYARYVDVADRIETPPLDPATTMEVVSPATLSLLQRLRREGFENEGEAARISDRFTAAAFGQVGATDYIARIDGEPAGSAMLFVSDGRALLGGMATLPAYRTRGVQGAMIRHRVARASELGSHLAVSTTVPAHRSGVNLQRHGFAVAFTMSTLRRDAPQRS
jgi:GNAT superfamily N-acetyltransferase